MSKNGSDRPRWRLIATSGYARLAVVGLVSGISLNLVPQIRADGFAPRGAFVSLLHDPATRGQIAEALNLTEEQRKQIDAVIAQFRQGVEQLEATKQLNPEKQRAVITDYHGRISAILKPPQLEKLSHISLQAKGTSALLDPLVAESLRLNEKQKERLRQIEEEAERKRRDVLNNLPRMTAAGLANLEIQQQKEKATAMTAVLDDRQRQEWQRLLSAH